MASITGRRVRASVAPRARRMAITFSGIPVPSAICPSRRYRSVRAGASPTRGNRAVRFTPQRVRGVLGAVDGGGRAGYSGAGGRPRRACGGVGGGGEGGRTGHTRG